MLRKTIEIFLVLFMLNLLTASAQAVVNTSVSVVNSAPELVSIRTFSAYTNDSYNTPSSCFNAVNDTVYIQVKIDEPNGYQDIVDDGYARVKIVLWDGTTESDFARFGAAYLDANLEAASSYLNTTIYTYSFVMDPADPSRTGNETPALYYRVKTQFSDGLFPFVSGTSAGDNADYNYPLCGTQSSPPEPPIPPLPPQPILFDVRIDVPANKQIISPGDSFYATVSVTKISPVGTRDIVLTYEIFDQYNNTVDSYSETVAVNSSTLYLTPVLYVPETAAPGTYTFKATVTLLEIDTWSSASFIVEGAATTTTSSTTTTQGIPSSSTTSTTRSHRGGGGGTGGETNPAREVPGEVSIYTYPREVQIFRGEVKPIVVVVENIGSSPVTNVYLDLDGQVKINKTVPNKIDSISPGVRRIFIMEVMAPEELSAGEYMETLKAVADNSQDKETIKFIVLDVPVDLTKPYRERTDWLKSVVDDVWESTVEISIEQRQENVTEVFSLLERSNEKLDEARESISKRKFPETEAALNQAQTYVEESVVKLTEIKDRVQVINQTVNQTTKEFIHIPYPVIDPGNLLLLLLLLLLIVALVIYDIKRRGRIGRKLEEAYEMSRLKDIIFKR